MTTSTQKVTRQILLNAVLASNQIIKTFKDTAVAYFCDRWKEENKIIIRQHDKAGADAVKQLKTELRDYRIDNALEQNGRLIRDAQTNEFEPADKSTKKALDRKIADIEEKIELRNIQFLEEEVEITVFTSPLKLPEEITFYQNKSLNGIVYLNENKFEKEFLTAGEEKPKEPAVNSSEEKTA
jgi:hypothetical protein